MMKLEETNNLKLPHVINIQTTTSHINNINDSDTGLSEKITEILNIYEKNPNFEGKPSFKNGVNIVDDTDTKSLIADRNKKMIKIYLTKTFKVIIVQEKHFQITPITL